MKSKDVLKLLKITRTNIMQAGNLELLSLIKLF